MWEDVEGQENFLVSAGFELTTHELLVQEHNYSATTHRPEKMKMERKNREHSSNCNSEAGYSLGPKKRSSNQILHLAILSLY